MQNYNDKFKEMGWYGGVKPGFSNADIYWWKKYNTETRCKCNDDKPGIQILVYGWDIKYSSEEHKEFEIELCAEPKDGEWVTFKVYGIKDESIFDVLEVQIQKLISAWEAINN
ncbi:MAG: hypothetical protein WC055_00945 [Melioribacteraceae bacterium]